MRMNPWFQTSVGVLAIIGVGFLAGVGHSLVRSKPIVLKVALPAPTTDDDQSNVDGLQRSPDPSSGGSSTGEPSDLLDTPAPAGKLTLREAYTLFEEGAYFIDARHEEEYNDSRIAYALFLPAQRLRTRVGLEELETIPPDATIVIYCVGGDCDASENTMIGIQQSGLGYNDIRIMGFGFSDWEAAGLPVEHSDGSVTGLGFDSELDEPENGESP
jgi:rhodanese-related sulfurtransferase